MDQPLSPRADAHPWRALVEQCRQGLHTGQDEARLRDELCRALDEQAGELALSDITISRLMQQVFAVDQHAIISVADGNGAILYANENFCAVSQYPYEELVGKKHNIVSSDYHPRSFIDDMWATISKGEVWRGTICNRNKSGEHYWVESTIVPTPAPGGNGYHYVAISTDVTALKRYEDILETANEKLEQRVAERTAELEQAKKALEADVDARRKVEAKLQHEQEGQRKLIAELHNAHGQLLQSEKMASIGQLAAGVAHEINNPIGYVHSNLGSLEKYIKDLMTIMDAFEAVEQDLPADSEAKSRIQALKARFDLDFLRQDIPSLMAESNEGITRVRKIVQDLKDFSHVDEVDWQWTNLHQGLDATLNIVWNELKYKTEVIKEYGNLPEIECFPSQLNQVFMNLLVNAGHAIETRGTITIRTGTKDEQVWVEIADSGKGIAPEHLTRIFEPFFTTKPVGKGTGLGLSVSYSIVKKHHGRIEVESEIGKGTTFRVWLPIKHVDA